MTNPAQLDLSEAITRLKKGELVVYPTETVFGLACDPRNHSAVEKLVSIKNRPDESGIPLIASSSSVLDELIGSEDEILRAARLKLQSKFWPGALTIVIGTNAGPGRSFARPIYGLDYSLAIRVSSSACASALAAGIGGVITSTSANPRALAPANNETEARRYFPDLFIVSDLEQAKNDILQKPSTIVDVRVFPFKILREGMISKEAIGKVCEVK